MRIFVGRLAAFLGIQIPVLGFVVWSVMVEPPSNGYLMALACKHRILEESRGPRIIFVGGSATAFGVDSPTFRDRLGLSPVNMGLQAGFGLEFMLGEVEDELKPGDIVVVTPEYETFFERGSKEHLRVLLRACPEAFQWFPVSDLKWTLDHGHEVAGEVMRRAIGNLFSPDSKEEAADGTPPYSLDSFNEYGDVVAHHGMNSRPSGDPNYIPDTFERFAWSPAVDRLNRFFSACQDRRVSVFVAHAPIMARARTETMDRILECLTAPKLLKPEEAAHPDADFFDSGYHLRVKPKMRRSALLAERIKDALEIQKASAER